MAKVALLIGVSEYEPGLNPLPAAVKDIEALQRVLKDSEMGGFDDVKALPNPDRQTMESEIETLFSGRAKDDLVLLFFSGHGIKDDGGKLYFATPITRKNSKGELIRSTAVPANFVQEIMNNSRAKRQVIILDCCFSGAFDPALQAKDDGLVDLQTQLGSEGRVVLTSSSSTQYSFEQQQSDLSIYTRYLVEGIETGAGDRDEDGFVSVLELHEYAVSKVQETAPNMTPKIIVLKDKGFEIFLSKARVTDPKLKYRKAASRYANAGTIRPSGRAVLNTLRQQLGLTSEEAAEIETEVLRPYQERLANLQTYRETLIAEAEHEYPLREEACGEMKMLQGLLGLRDNDILPIKQEVESQFALRGQDTTGVEQPLLRQAEISYQEKLRQEQEQAEYENKLLRYKQEFSIAVQAEYPLSESVIAGLNKFQQSLELKTEEVELIEKEIIVPKEAEFQKKQAENLKLEEGYQYNKLLEAYESEVLKEIQKEFPLGEKVKDKFKHLQKIWGLKKEDIDKIELPILANKEVEYQKSLELENNKHGQRKQNQDQHRLNSLKARLSRLRELLKAKKWEEADEETWNIMFEAADYKGQVFSSIQSFKDFPCNIISEVNDLWLKHSGGYFGFSVQKQLWEETKKHGDAQRNVFCQKLKPPSIRLGKGSDYKLDIETCPRGYFPRKGKSSQYDMRISWVFDWQSDFWIENFDMMYLRLNECGI